MSFQQQKPGRSSAADMVVDISDPPLHQFGFVFDCFTPTKVSGRLPVTARCCQPFGKLHGGVSALIAESLASLGAILACGAGKAAGIQLSINHLKSAQLGDVVYAEATPIIVGKSIQVWEVRLWKTTPSISEEKVLTSTSRVTIVSNIYMSEADKDAVKPFKKYAKL